MRIGREAKGMGDEAERWFTRGRTSDARLPIELPGSGATAGPVAAWAEQPWRVAPRRVVRRGAAAAGQMHDEQARGG